MKKSENKVFLKCIESNIIDLQVGKDYQQISDPGSEGCGFYRIIDDSGESYLYPKRWFVEIEI
jgi:hypothetical protein